MKIELEQTFKDNLSSGINLFLGAGFSIYAKDKNGNNLPLGSFLAEELCEKFECPKLNDLTKVCTIIDSTNSVALQDFLIERFTVEAFDEKYKNILKINSPRIFTTNVDNLPFKIFDGTTRKYLNNVFVNGTCFNDSACVDYIPIHGSVEMPDKKFLFNQQQVSGSHRTQINAWMSLTQAANQIPSLFLGYSLEDVGAIESLYGGNEFQKNQKEKWILLHKQDDAMEAYFRALGFKTIIGDIMEFCQYLSNIQIQVKQTPAKTNKKDSIEEIYPKATVPRNNKTGVIRQIDDFFLGSSPVWSDVLSHRIFATHHLDILADRAVQQKHLIVTGIPASGKSTLMLQLANKLKKTKRILIFDDLTFNKSNIIKNEIKIPTIVLVDNCTSDIDAFVNLGTNKLINLVGFDRYYNIDISYHRLPDSEFQIYDISEITDKDIQGISGQTHLII